MDRRRFLQVTAVTIAGAGLGACGDEDDGPDIPEEGQDVGTPDEVATAIEDGGGSWYVAEARTYVVPVPAAHREALAAAVPEAIRPGVEAGLLALWQKCPHQGCRVPWCESSGWFECPCHGSRFSPFGELRRGPAERGMSYLPIALKPDAVRLLPGPVDGLEGDVTGSEAAGPHCV